MLFRNIGLVRLGVLAACLVIVGCANPERSKPSGGGTGPNDVVAGYQTKIPDPGLRAALEASVGKVFGQITYGDLSKVEWVSGQGGIADLTGIELCVNLVGVSIFDEEVTNLSPLGKIPKLRQIWLQGNRIVDLTPIRGLSNLTALFVSDNPLSAASLALITPTNFPSLAGIGLGDEDEGLPLVSAEQALGVLKPFKAQLRMLALFHVPLGDQGFNRLWDEVLSANHENIAFLNLGDCDLTDAIFPAKVSTLSALSFLFLWDNQLDSVAGVEGLAHLSAVSVAGNDIQDLTSFQAVYDNGGFRTPEWSEGLYLDLSDNEADLRPGSANRTMVDALKGRGVDVVFERGNRTTEPFLDAATKIPDVQLRAVIEGGLGRKFGTGVDNINQADLDEVTYLDFYDKGIADLTGLGSLKNLEEFWGGENLYTNLDPLVGLSRLWVIGLDGSPVTQTEVAKLTPTAFPNLRRIKLLGTDQDGVARLSWEPTLSLLAGHSHLEGVELYSFEMDDDDFTSLYNQVIAKNVATFSVLSLDGNELIGDDSLAKVAGLSRLRVLGLGWTSITSLASLATLIHLEELSISGTDVGDLTPLKSLYDAGAFRAADSRVRLEELGLNLAPGSAQRAIVDYLVDHGVTVEYEEGNTL